jgi:exonuclease SbcC
VELERARGRLLDAMRARETAERAYQEARVEREAALRSLAEAEAAAHAAAAELEASRAYLAEKERERRRIDAERERVQEAIRPALAAIGEFVGVEADAALDRVGPDLLVRLRASLEARAEARRAEARIAGALALLEGARGAAQSALVRAQAELVMAEEEHRAASAALATQTAQRRAILDGEADACEEGARREVEAARAELARCRAEKAAALAVVEAAERALEVEVRAAEEAARAVAEARARLARVLAEVGLDEVTARASLARSPAEIAEIRRECEQLEERRARWRAIFEERAARRALHERQRPSGLLPREHIALELETARELEEDARRRLASAEERRARDDRLRAERAAKETELEARRARVRTWSELDDLIGSPTGQRFRIFAQHLTLGILLEHANAHLERLAPRYALVRAPGADLGLQVIDRDMGGEIRGIRSLSGGETFLVSLALALGVGSLAARRVRVDSLFIDEGFGGLDAESLETVLAALDALQATGRQVGIISHVGAIAERFAARIEVRPRGQAESTVAVVG